MFCFCWNFHSCITPLSPHPHPLLIQLSFNDFSCFFNVFIFSCIFIHQCFFQLPSSSPKQQWTCQAQDSHSGNIRCIGPKILSIFDHLITIFTVTRFLVSVGHVGHCSSWLWVPSKQNECSPLVCFFIIEKNMLC